MKLRHTKYGANFLGHLRHEKMTTK